MMRKLYFLIALVITSTTTLAQRYADFALLETRIGTAVTNMAKITPGQKIFLDGQTKYHIIWIIVAYGPDSLADNDSFYLKSNGVTYPITGPQGIPGADTFGISPAANPIVFNIPPGATPGQLVAAPWCDSIWIATGPGNTPIIDPDMSNNYFCENIQAQYGWAIGINTVTDEKDGFLLYPNPANDKLNVRFDFDNAKGVAILLRNSVGQNIYVHTVGDYTGTLTQSIDISYLPPGVYTAELHYDNQTVISKVIKQ